MSLIKRKEDEIVMVHNEKRNPIVFIPFNNIDLIVFSNYKVVVQ